MGRMPACSTNSLVGERTTSGLMSFYGTNNTANRLIDQGFLGGNRIGHSPSTPKQFIAPSSHKRPPSLSDIIKEFSQSYFESHIYQGLYYHFDKDGKATRKMRSEFREMISMGCSILTHYYDVMSGEIGFRNEYGKMIRFSYKQFSIKLNVSIIRVKRFFKYLKDRNFITIIEDKGKDEKGAWKSNISRKLLNPSFFIRTLGMDAWKKISQFKDWLIKRSKPKTKDQSANVSMVKSLISTMVANVKTRKSKTTDTTVYKDKLLIEKALILHQEDPSKSLADYLKELKHD